MRCFYGKQHLLSNVDLSQSSKYTGAILCRTPPPWPINTDSNHMNLRSMLIATAGVQNNIESWLYIPIVIENQTMFSMIIANI